jgi:DNA-binding transcriptional LysR family regulator
MPTFRQLKALGLVGELGSFTKAAQQLHLTQSAVSILIRELEEEVGQPLLQRGRSIRFTPAGTTLHRAAAVAAQEVDRALLEIRSSEGAERPLIRVAAGPLSAAMLVAPALGRLARQADGPRVLLIDRPVGMLAETLLSGEADLAIGSVGSPRMLSEQLQSSLLLSDGLVVVGARDHPAQLQCHQDAGLGWAALARWPLVLVGRNGGQWDALLAEPIARHQQLQQAYEVQLFSTALELVREQLGLALLPSCATRTLDPAAFRWARLSEAQTRWNIYGVTRRDGEQRQHAVAQFLQALRAGLEAPAAPP